jgi:hypothetical protein
MKEHERITDPEPVGNERDLDRTLRPQSLDEFVGQESLREQLRIAVEAARGRGEALDHLLFHGPPGLGKTTLASILAHEMDVSMVQTSGPVLERAADLAGLLTNLEERAVLFIDEIHRMNPVVEEYLYPAIEDFRLDIMIDRGPSARSVRIDLKRFSLIGATTRTGSGAPPLARFGTTARLDLLLDRRARPDHPHAIGEIPGCPSMRRRAGAGSRSRGRRAWGTGSCAACAISPRRAPRGRSPRRWRATRSSSSRWTSADWTTWTGACSRRSW